MIGKVMDWLLCRPTYQAKVGFEINARRIERANNGVEVIDME